MKLWVAIVMSVSIGFAVSYLLGFVVIPWLRKLHFGQTILDIGPSWHKKKQGTPTMGGVLIITGFAVALAATLLTAHFRGADLIAEADDIKRNARYVKIFAGLLMSLGFALIGFIDDYIKVVKKRNLGLTELQKTVLQLLCIAGFLTSVSFQDTSMFIPYYNGVFNSRIVFWVVGVIAIYCTVNAANFLDGADGLCASVTSVICVGFAVSAAIYKFTGVSIVAAAQFGALAGYLMWNWNPAKVMMGDVGSLFLGGMVCTMAYALDAPWAILLIGVIYVAEFGSDVLQIIYIKTHHGKKLFRMAPIHHHYELGGWSEKKLCVVFSLVTLLGAAAAVALFYFGQPHLT
ncbi:MAG: phospho-N-acetylmuramoyl-pentapeptide-transferase [Clostridia bacterium]|nr:phospho-N-acetylmuramoyl-pentapeptide-transferase [Clostridia bacterium]